MKLFKKTFTLTEFLIVMAIVAAIAGFGIFNFYPYWRSKNLEGMAEKIAIFLENAKAKSMVQENGSSWGVHFENPTSSQSFFSLFYGSYSTSTTIQTIYLPNQIEFSDPSDGNFKEIIFEKITGKTGTSTQIKIYLISSPSEQKTIEVNSFGKIEVR
ncbi:prepilin-type N-terminal cleavage/methylation domain-containing protein [bacterium]|nr:prepilin-type N-terminal cleavage/methylation domain-containing protein [bacterium]